MWKWLTTRKRKIEVITFLFLIIAIIFLTWRAHEYRMQLQTYQGQTVFSEGPDLGAVLHEVKQQIAASQEDAARAGEADTWKIDDIDLELSFTIKQEQSSEGHAETKLIAVTDTRNISAERVQRVTFHLSHNSQYFPGQSGPGATTTPPPFKNQRQPK